MQLPIPLVDDTPHSKIIELFKHLGLAELIHFTSDIQYLPVHVASVMNNEQTWRKKLERVFKDQRIILQEALANCFSKSREASEEVLVSTMTAIDIGCLLGRLRPVV